MTLTQVPYYQFDDFLIEELAEPNANYSLFPINLSSIQKEQSKIFQKLEANFPLANAFSFSNQVHFQEAYKIPVQRWYPYREGYSTKLVDAFLKELKTTGLVFDPFSGSGTTLLSARNSGLKSFGIDVNPLSVLVAQVENEDYTQADKDQLEFFIDAFRQYSFEEENEYNTPFELASKVFNKDVLKSLLFFRNKIESITNYKVRNLIKVAWLSLIEEVSNIKKEGNGIKYKNRKRTSTGYIDIHKEEWENSVFPENKFEYVQTKLVKHLQIISFDLQNQYGSTSNKPTIFQGSCLDFDNFFNDPVEFTFFSPPYCNCFDYFEIHKVDLWIGGFVNDKDDFKRLRTTGFRSNINSVANKEVAYHNNSVEQLINLFDPDRLWHSKIPHVVRGYFDDTHTLLKKLFEQTKEGGYVGIVVGNSAYSGVIVPTDLIIADIATHIGFDVQRIFITRHLTTSSQQKKDLECLKPFLRESIVLLKK